MILAGIQKVHSGMMRSVGLVKRHLRFFCRHNTGVKFLNLCLLYFQRWTNRSTLSAYPIEIIIDPINICNLRCPLCPTGQRVSSRPLGRMSFENVQRIIDELTPWLYKIRFYNWGEPLLHPDICKMIAYATRKNIGTEMSTNLNVLDPGRAGALIESGLELLIISLDGADSKTYSQYRIGGDFSRVINNISALVEAKKKSGGKYPVIELQFLTMKHNESQIPAMKALARELGVDSLRFGPVTINIKNKDDWRWLPASDKMSRYSYRNKKDKIYSQRKKCEWLWRSTVINWDGTVAPCCVYEIREAEFGSLEGKRFAEIWNNENYVHSREVFTKKSRNAGGTRVICSTCKGLPEAMNDEQHGLY